MVQAANPKNTSRTSVQFYIDDNRKKEKKVIYTTDI